MPGAPKSNTRVPRLANIRTDEAAPVKSGDRRPVRQTPVVPLRRCLRLVVGLPLHRSLPPTRGTTTLPTVYHTLLELGRAPGGSRLLCPSCPAQHVQAAPSDLEREVAVLGPGRVPEFL